MAVYLPLVVSGRRRLLGEGDGAGDEGLVQVAQVSPYPRVKAAAAVEKKGQGSNSRRTINFWGPWKAQTEEVILTWTMMRRSWFLLRH